MNWQKSGEFSLSGHWIHHPSYEKNGERYAVSTQYPESEAVLTENMNIAYIRLKPIHREPLTIDDKFARILKARQKAADRKFMNY